MKICVINGSPKSDDKSVTMQYILYLQKRLPSLTVVAEKPANRNQVFFGATVTLEMENAETVRYRIVGADEIDSSGNLISLDSPLARLLLKKELDDEVVFRQGERLIRYYIIDIEY